MTDDEHDTDRDEKARDETPAATAPGSYAGPSDPALAGPGDEKPRDGQVNEPDDRTVEQRRIAEDAARAERGPAPDQRHDG